MPPDPSPHSKSRRHHPTAQSSRQRRPHHSSPNSPGAIRQPPPHQNPDMSNIASPSYYASSHPVPGPYVQPGHMQTSATSTSTSSSSLPAPPPHVYPRSFHRAPTASHPQPPLPQRHAHYALETLRDAALAHTTETSRSRPAEAFRGFNPTVTRIVPATLPPEVEGILPQYPPGYVPKDFGTYIIAPHQIPIVRLAPLPDDPEPCAGTLERIEPILAQAPPISPPTHRRPSLPVQYRDSETTFATKLVDKRPKPKRKRFGELPEEGESLSDGPLKNLTLKGPTSPTQARDAPDWQEISRRMLHPRSLYSPPSPPRRPLPKLENSRSRRSSASASAAVSRASSQSQSKSNSQAESRSNSQNDLRGSQAMVATQRSALDLDVAPLMVNELSSSTVGTTSTRETILASPHLPPRPDIADRSLSFQLPAPILGSITHTMGPLPPIAVSTGLKRRWSDDERASKRGKEQEHKSSPMGKGGTYWKSGQ